MRTISRRRINVRPVGSLWETCPLTTPRLIPCWPNKPCPQTMPISFRLFSATTVKSNPRPPTTSSTIAATSAADTTPKSSRPSSVSGRMVKSRWSIMRLQLGQRARCLRITLPEAMPPWLEQWGRHRLPRQQG